MNVKTWISAFRLRTLPLSVAGIVLGGFVAYSEHNFSSTIFLLTLTTAILLQILSNLANDYGDYSNGIDNDKRMGPTRTVQSGKIKPKQMKIAIIICTVITFILGVCLLFVALKKDMIKLLVFLAIGISSIVAAVKYTVGKKNYGYRGLGDIVVFLFFGFVAVIGTYFLQTKTINYTILLPASIIGLFSTGVLNLNNMRDIENDKTSKKITLAVKLGIQKSKVYHFALIIVAMILTIVYLLILKKIALSYIILLPFSIISIHLANVKKHYNTPTKLNSELKILSINTLFYSIVLGIIILL